MLRTAKSVRGQSGVMLIEVLISLIIVAVGLLGLAGLHLRSQQAETEAYQRAQALMLLNDIENRIRSNRGEALGGNYAGSFGTGATEVSCKGDGSPGDQANCDKQLFHQALLGAAEQIGTSNVGAMEGARGCIEFNTAGGLSRYEVAVAWKGMASIPTDGANFPFKDAKNALDCGKGAYGADDGIRRFIFIYIDFPQLS